MSLIISLLELDARRRSASIGVFLLVGLGILHGVASPDSPYQVDDQTTDG